MKKLLNVIIYFRDIYFPFSVLHICIIIKTLGKNNVRGKRRKNRKKKKKEGKREKKSIRGRIKPNFKRKKINFPPNL